MKRSGWVKAAYAVVAVASLAINFLVSGAVIALVDLLQLWAYPVIFFTGLGLIAFVLVILIPPTKKGSISVLPALKEKMEKQHEARMTKGFWKWLHGRGPLVLIVATTVLIGPFLGALAARFLGLADRKAWVYLTIANAVSVALWVSIYIGAIAWIRDVFMRIATP